MPRSEDFRGLRFLTEGLPSIVLLSTMDLPGAGGAALDLCRGLRAAGADVTMLTLGRTHHLDWLKEVPGGHKFFTIGVAQKAVSLRPYTAIPSGFELFSLAKAPPALDSVASLLRTAGLIHLHWVTGMVDWSRPPDLLRGKALVWTLHDMNPLTGGCHCTAGCGKWREDGCSACPQLGEAPKSKDLAAVNFAQKKAAYAKLDMHIVSPSRWLGRCAGQSLLLGQNPVTLIPNSVNITVFHSQMRATSRAALGLPEGRQVLCFGASGISRKNKGLPVLVRALELLRHWHEGPLPLLLTFGGEGMEWLPAGYESRQLGYLSQPEELATAYAAADGFLCPSFQDNFPNSLLESLACGTPSIGFRGTGAEDIIEDGVTGFLAKHPGLPITDDGKLAQNPPYHVSDENVADLAKQIQKCLSLSEAERQAMRIACRQRAECLYSPPRQVEACLRLYRNILGLPTPSVTA